MRTSEQDRRHYVELYGSSGLSPVMFCAQHSIKVKTFYAWLKRYPFPLGETSTLSPSLNVLGDSLPPEDCFMPLKISDVNPEHAVMPGRGPMESPSDGSRTSPLMLCFKTPHFCLDVSLNMEENFAQFKLILQAFQSLK